MPLTILVMVNIVIPIHELSLNKSHHFLLNIHILNTHLGVHLVLFHVFCQARHSFGDDESIRSSL